MDNKKEVTMMLKEKLSEGLQKAEDFCEQHYAAILISITGVFAGALYRRNSRHMTNMETIETLKAIMRTRDE